MTDRGAPQVSVEPLPALVRRLAGTVADAAADALAARGRCVLLLTGGSLATTFFPALAALDLDWSRIDFVWGDERAVPTSSPESNFRAACELWLDPAKVPQERRHRMPADREDLDAAAAAYGDLLVRLAGRPARVDLALLGVGPDGHVCSLFPGHALLEERARLVAAVEDSPKPPPRRLTVTLPLLAGSRRVVVVAVGATKRAAIAAALGDPRSQLPVARVARFGSRPLFLLDPPAAGEPSPRGAVRARPGTVTRIPAAAPRPRRRRRTP